MAPTRRVTRGAPIAFVVGMSSIIPTAATSSRKTVPFYWGKLAAVGIIALSSIGAGALAVGGCRQSPPVAAAATASPTFDAAALEGTWFIVASDQPTWISGEKSSPALHYKVTGAEEGRATLEDRVTFVESGAPSELRGRDTQEAEGALSFTWRGTGALSLVSTSWRVMHVAPDKSWAITFYEKTIATPAGVAIISRTPALTAPALAEARAFLVDHSTLSAHVEGLREVSQSETTPSSGS